MFDFINDGGYDYCTAGTLIYVLYASLRPAVSAVRERLANSELFSMRARVCVVCFECDECAHLLACVSKRARWGAKKFYCCYDVNRYRLQ